MRSSWEKTGDQGRKDVDRLFQEHQPLKEQTERDKPWREGRGKQGNAEREAGWKAKM